MSLKVVTEDARTGGEDNLVGVDHLVLDVAEFSAIVPDIDLEQYLDVGEFGRVVVANGVSIGTWLVAQMLTYCWNPSLKVKDGGDPGIVLLQNGVTFEVSCAERLKEGLRVVACQWENQRDFWRDKTWRAQQPVTCCMNNALSDCDPTL